MVEASVALLLLALVMLWVLPRISSPDQLAGDRQAQLAISETFSAALRLRVEDGVFPLQTSSVDPLVPGVEVVGPTVDVRPGQVSLKISSSAPTATLSASALSPDGVCWLARRSFGAAEFDGVYGYMLPSDGSCAANDASGISASGQLGSSFTRPVQTPAPSPAS